MGARAYVLINTTRGHTNEVLKTLWGKPGIAFLECVEGPPDILLVAEANDRQKLAELTVNALASVEHLTEGVQCLPVNDWAFKRLISSLTTAS